jgi:uncharacterized damage-inducible protein DinB
MKKGIRHYYMITLALLLSSTMQAQSLDANAIKAQMVKDWERAKAYTVAYLNTMPADKYSFKPVDSIRSFAQQMLHLAAGNTFLLGPTTMEKIPAGIDPGLEMRPSAQTKDSVMHYILASYDFAIAVVKNSDVNKWGEVISLLGGKLHETRFAIMNKAFEHQGHHRGQTTIYIRLNGIRPPQEQLF